MSDEFSRSIASAVSQAVQRAVDEALSRLPSQGVTSSSSSSTSNLLAGKQSFCDCVRLKSSVLFNTEYLAIFKFPDLLQYLMLVPVVCMLFQQLHKSCVFNGNPPSFTHCIFSPLRDFVDSRQVIALRRVETPNGYSKSVIRGGSAPRSNPLPFYIPFFQKRHPFRIPFIGKRHPFHIPSHWPTL